MNRDDIIRMAREAGVDVDTAWGVSDAAMERFAALVTEREREACAKVCDDVAAQDGLTKEQRLALHVSADAIRARGKA